MQKLTAGYPKRGEIYIADLEPPYGREMRKKRPALVISNNTLNQILPTVIAIPFSSIIPQFLGPDAVKFVRQRGLSRDSALVINQMRAMDKNRLIKRIGRVSKIKMAEVADAIKAVLEI
ncbi:type II toxin-antitoxin system PemK/MazF family toxin [Candidatus Daviesbacteria bacterium]|nr:type II toxin-antitoxin system PemK/MazF family toxin [Candidatus Daviesbacteria bacterium]